MLFNIITTRTQKLFFLSSVLILLFFSSHISADMVRQPVHEKKMIPACLISWNNGPDYVVLVDKSRQKVFVYNKKDIFNPYKVFNCSTGKNKGPKREENDVKTPEGIYFFTKSVDDRYLTPVYGSHALPIDYPNIIDGIKGRGGYGIWFHGTDRVLKPYDSNGCIAMENGDIKELAKLITLFETPIVIESSIEMVPENQVKSLVRELTGILEKWRISWGKKDINKYMSFYSENFTSEGKNRIEWKEYRSELAKKDEIIDFEINNLSLFRHGGVIVASFDQKHKFNSSENYNRKRLYLTKESNQWKISGEISIEQKNP